MHQDNVAEVLEFFEKYEVRGSEKWLMPLWLHIIQAKVADLDTRLASGTRDMASVKEKIAVLKANADKLNPNKKTTSTSETIRCKSLYSVYACEHVSTLSHHVVHLPYRTSQIRAWILTLEVWHYKFVLDWATYSILYNGSGSTEVSGDHAQHHTDSVDPLKSQLATMLHGFLCNDV